MSRRSSLLLLTHLASVHAGGAALKDLTRARQVKPRACLTGHDYPSIAETLNRHLQQSSVRTRSCGDYDLFELDQLATTLLAARDERLDDVYKSVSDRRMLRHASVAGWKGESRSAAAATLALQLALRDGKCAELVMIWAHHVPSATQRRLVDEGLVMPLLSKVDHIAVMGQNSAATTADHLAEVYTNQTGCRICHRAPSEGDAAVPERHTQSALPPVLSPRFHVEFDECSKDFSAYHCERGSLHLDYNAGKMKWVHGKGQHNNWCECAGLGNGASCEILSTKTSQDPAGAAYLLFKEINHCCKVAGWDHGFGPMRPDWLTRSNATFQGQHIVGGRVCYQWASHAHGDPLQAADVWSEDAEGVPCFYIDQMKWWSKETSGHNLTFVPTTYSTSAETDDVFQIPGGMDCSRTCPNRLPWCWTTTHHSGKADESRFTLV